MLDTVPIGQSGNDANNAVIRANAYHFMVSGQYDEAVSYVEENFASLDAMLQQFERTDGSNSGYLAPLAYSYLQAGRESEFKKLTDALAETVVRREVARDKSFGSIFNSINLAALTGTDEEVLIHAQRLIDNNGVGVNVFDTPISFSSSVVTDFAIAIFDRMRENAEFQMALLTPFVILVKRGNCFAKPIDLCPERANYLSCWVGLDPYEPALPASASAASVVAGRETARIK